MDKDVDRLEAAAQNPKSDNALKEYQNLSELLQLWVNEFRQRKTLFADENFIYHVATMLFFKLDDNLDEGLDGGEIIRRMDLFKKKFHWPSYCKRGSKTYWNYWGLQTLLPGRI